MSDITEEEIARAIYEGKPRNKPWDILPHEFKNQYRKQARAVLALVHPAIERARVEGMPAYHIAEPEGGFRAHGAFTPDEKAKLRPIAETLAMLDGNAFFGMGAGVHADWSDQYLPEAVALYEANGGDGGWAGKASFAAAIRKG